jgi:uncharacterized protein YmfQ (DUF2313 family)
MAKTQFQPVLPAPVPLTEEELNFIDESPPNLFAENQNSNIGLKRKIFSDQMTDVRNQIALLYSERFVNTSVQLLDMWEEQVGIAINPTGLTTAQRRARILSALNKQPFTRARRQAVVETFLTATFGNTIRLTPDGVPFSAAGLQLFSDASSLTGLYTITENITNFSYAVSIQPTALVDQAALVRELRRITPAHINFTVTFP